MPTLLLTKTCRPRKEHGFTLLELLIVTILLGTLAAAALPLFNQAMTESKLDAATYAVVSAINFARVQSLTSQRSLRIKIDVTDDSFKVERLNYKRLDDIQDEDEEEIDGDDVDYDPKWEHVADPLRNAGLDSDDQFNYDVDFTDDPLYQGANISGTSFPSSTLTFSTMGLPNSGGTVTIQLGGLQRTVTVNGATGAVTTS